MQSMATGWKLDGSERVLDGAVGFKSPRPSRSDLVLDLVFDSPHQIIGDILIGFTNCGYTRPSAEQI